jgi:hypothetical protein
MEANSYKDATQSTIIQLDLRFMGVQQPVSRHAVINPAHHVITGAKHIPPKEEDPPQVMYKALGFLHAIHSRCELEFL